MEGMVEVIVGIAAGCLLGGITIWLVQGSRAKSRLARMEADWVKEKAALREENAGLKGQLEQSSSAEKIVEMAKEQLNERFQATASLALQANNSQFMDLAQENLGKTLEAAKGDFKQRHEQFEALVKPLTQNYEKLNPQINLLAQRSESLATETGKLSSALTDNRQIGNWGEVQLRRVVELAGMEEYCDFREQAAIGDSQSRPDLTVRLPEQRTVVIDAKTSTAAFMDAQEAEDREARDSSLKRHASALKAQVGRSGEEGLWHEGGRFVGLCGDVRSRRPVSGGGAERQSGADRVRDEQEGGYRHAGIADFPVVVGRQRVAAPPHRRECRSDIEGRRRAAQSDDDFHKPLPGSWQSIEEGGSCF